MHRKNLNGYAFWHIRFCCLHCYAAAGVYVMAGLYFSLCHGCRFNLHAGTYSLVRCISVCVLCAGLTCTTVDCSATSYPHFDKKESFAAYAAAEHLLLSVATKVGKSASNTP